MTLLELISIIRSGQNVNISHFSKDIYEGEIDKMKIKGNEEWLNWEVSSVETSTHFEDTILIFLKGEL